MKVVFLTKYNKEGASSRYRSFNYSNYFRSAQIEYRFLPLFYDGYVRDLYANKKNILKIMKSYFNRIIFLTSTKGRNTFFIIEKELFPHAPYFIEKTLLKNKKYSIDYDDAVFVKYKRNAFLKKKHIQLAQNAEFITVGNHWYNSQFSTNKCIYLPTVVDIEKYPLHFKQNNKVPIICWIGTPTNIKYVQDIIPVLKKIKASGIQFKLRIIGGHLYDEDLDIENIKWREETEYDNLASGDIGIMPLFNSNWENGKCGFKLIQYMISRLPVIGSPSPANMEIITHRENGFIAKNHHEWEHYLSRLCLDSSLRMRLGESGRKTIIEKYSYQKWGTKYVRLVKNIPSFSKF